MSNYHRVVDNPGVHVTTNFSGSVTNTPVVASRFVNSKDGEVTPNYRELARLGKLPMLPYYFRVYKRLGAIGSKVTKDTVGTYDYATHTVNGDWNANGGGIAGTCAYPMNHSSAEQAALQDLALTKALNDVKNQKINVLQDIGEGRQTLSLLSGTVQRLGKAYQNFKRGNLPGAVKALGTSRPSRSYRKKFNSSQGAAGKDGSVFTPQNLSNLWLEFQYGWRPLVQSAQGAVDLYNQKLLEGELIQVVSRYKNREIKTETTETYAFPTEWKATHVNQATHTYKVKYTLYYTIADADAVTSAQAGLTNLPNLGWELIPFSFVVDWFVNIGAYLSTLDATRGLSFVKGCKTTSWEVSAVKTSEFSSEVPHFDISGTTASTLEDFRLWREVLTEFPSPVSPRFTRRSLGVQRYISGLALLTSAFAGGSGGIPYHMR